MNISLLMGKYSLNQNEGYNLHVVFLHLCSTECIALQSWLSGYELFYATSSFNFPAVKNY